MYSNLTEREVAVLGQEFNLADGHAFRPWNSREKRLVDDLPQRFRQDDRARMGAITEAYFDAFFGLAAQTLDRRKVEMFPCFTASSGIELIANYLRLQQQSVTLIEPCFDNLKDILRRHQVPLTPFPDATLLGDSDALEARLAEIDTDVLFLVSPNNPTGTTISAEAFTQIIDFCSRRGVTLILDSCFRFYLPDDAVHDQYKMLIDSDIDWMVIEDTGKTWPTLEIKAPFISVSGRLAPAIARINSDFLLHVSPFALRLLTDFIDLSAADGRRSIRALVAENRARLNAVLLPTFLHPVESPFMSVSWLRIDDSITASDLVKALGSQGVHALPGNDFFWSDERLGDSFLRVALVRDTSMFATAAEIIAQVCHRTRELVAR